MFNFLKPKSSDFQQVTNGHPFTTENSPVKSEGSNQSESIDPEIPERIFIEKAKPRTRQSMEQEEAKQSVNDLQTLYRYLEQDLEKKGYEDALINPDTSYMNEHVQFISNELSLLIAKVNTYYSGYIRTIDFHIETRKRSGMLETVDELLSHKATVLEEISKVTEIENESKAQTGISQNIILSYKKGFRNGFAAITYNTVLGKRNLS